MKQLTLNKTEFLKLCIEQAGSTDPNILALEIWNQASSMIYGLSLGQLATKQADKLSDVLFDNYNILTASDIKTAIMEAGIQNDSITDTL